MRHEYIKIIKEYITQKIQRNYTLDQIKADVIRAGATIEEFNESLSQLTTSTNASSPKAHEKTRSSNLFKSRKFVLSFLILFIFSLSIIFIIQANNSRENTIIISSIPKTSTQNTNSKSGPIAQVYANAQPIDPERAFSYPKSNIPLVVTNKPKKEVLGFFPYWMLTRTDDINLGILTSISIFGLEVDGKGNIVIINNETDETDPGWQMWKDPKLDKFIKKARNNGLKIFLTLKAFDNKNIESLVNSDPAQKAFIANALYLASSKNLDGINLDFEYVGTPSSESRKGFTRLVANLSSELKRQFPNAVLSIDTYAISGSVPGLFELELLSKDVDVFVIMGYDLHTAKGNPGPISPMGGNINIIGFVQGYLEKVAPEKLILAVPYYGYDWPTNYSSDSLGSASILPYSEIAEASSKHNLLWDDISQTPWYSYTTNGEKREVHFDNVRSLGIKYDYVNAKNLKGVGIWALGYDGFNSDLQRLIIDKFSN